MYLMIMEKMIADAIQGVEKGEDCEYGVFCSVATVRVESAEIDGPVVISSSHKISVNIIMMIMLCIVFIQRISFDS